MSRPLARVEPTEQPGSPAVEVEVRDRPRRRLAPPRHFRVLLHDDDFTTMEFVVGVLTGLFGHGLEAATRIMLDVHHRGVGLAGVYPFEVAEAKAEKVVQRARAEGFPFLATIEPEPGDPEPGGSAWPPRAIG